MLSLSDLASIRKHMFVDSKTTQVVVIVIYLVGEGFIEVVGVADLNSEEEIGVVALR